MVVGKTAGDWPVGTNYLAAEGRAAGGEKATEVEASTKEEESAATSLVGRMAGLMVMRISNLEEDDQEAASSYSFLKEGASSHTVDSEMIMGSPVAGQQVLN